jgi:hypothetical protein
MTAPLILLFSYPIRDGKLQEFEEFNHEFASFIEAKEPRLIGYEVYVNEDGTQATSVLIHPDAESEDFHMQVAGEKLQQGYALMDTTKLTIDVYGSPSDAVLEQLRNMAESGITLRLKPHHFGGFTRLMAA